MDEIFALQAALAKAQLADTAHRISERNAVEIVLKLIDMKKVQLLFAKSGREYVTPAQVVEEVEMELVASGGRLTLTEVAPMLQLDLVHVETAARTLVAKGKKVRELAGQLITDYYLDGVIEEVNEALQAAGSVSMLDMAQRFSLPAELMRSAIEQRMGTGGVDGYIEEGQLYTATFIQQHAARTRGIMRALVRPTALRTLIQRHGLMESRLAKEVAALIKEGAIAGSLKGAEDRAVYTPDLFLRAQNSGVDSFFATNGYVEYAKLERLSIPNPRAFLAAKYPSALALQSMSLSESMVGSVVMACEDALSSNLFAHATAILPSVLSRAEVEQVLQHAVQTANKAAEKAGGKDKAPQLHVMAEVWAVSSVFRSEAQQFLSTQLEQWLDEEDARLAAAAAASASSPPSTAAPPTAAAAAPAKKSAKAAVPDSDDDEEAADSKKKGGKGGKKGAKGKAQADDEDEAPAGKGKDKKKQRRKKGDVSDDDDEPAAAAPVKSKGQIRLPSAAAASAAPAPLTRDRVLKWLKSSWESVVRDAQRGHAEVQAADAIGDESTEELIRALAAVLYPALLTQHKSAVAARAAALATASGASVSGAPHSSLGAVSDAVLRRQQLECFRTNAQDLYEQILLYQHAIEYMGGAAVGGDDKSASAAPPSSLKVDKHLLGQLESHLCKTLCASLLDLLLRMECFGSLTTAQQNQLPGMDNIIVLADAPAAQEKDATPAARAASRFELNRTPLALRDREAALSALPKRSSDALRPLVESLSKEPALFLDRLESTAARALDLPLRKLDKKSERSRVFALRKSLMASLGSEQRPAVVLHLTTLLLFAKVHSVMPHAPAKCIPAIRRLLRPDTQPGAYARLRRYNQLVLRSLRVADADDPSASLPPSSSAAANASVGGIASDSEDEAADEEMPLEQQVKHFAPAAVAQELESGKDSIRAYGLDASTAVKGK